jgi:putative ABC transport system ATP-binding protein
VLVAEDLELVYGRTKALAGVNATIERGEVVAVVGSSGSGKTSLLYCLAALARPSAGRVRFEARDLSAASLEELARLRRETFGFVFQFAELVPELTLRENVGLPLELLRTSRRAVRDRTTEILDRLGLVEHADRRPAQVSGGQAQRAAVARALVHRPRVLFADEPTGSLDTRNGELVLQAMLELSRDAGTAVVLVTHDEKVAAAADRILPMQDGRILEDRTC